MYFFAYGNKTIQWKKGYGIDGYIVEQYKQGAAGKKEWVEILYRISDSFSMF